MVLRRSELEITYLEHQLRALRRLLPEGAIEVISDWCPSGGLYDFARLRLQCSEFLQAYQLLHPQDQFTISRQVLEIAGLEGIASLWVDCGSRGPRGAILLNRRYRRSDWDNLADYLDSIGQPTVRPEGKPPRRESNTDSGGGAMGLILREPRGGGCPPLLEKIYPLVHYSMRHTLRRPGAKRFEGSPAREPANL